MIMIIRLEIPCMVALPSMEVLIYNVPESKQQTYNLSQDVQRKILYQQRQNPRLRGGSNH